MSLIIKTVCKYQGLSVLFYKLWLISRTKRQSAQLFEIDIEVLLKLELNWFVENRFLESPKNKQYSAGFS